MNNLISDDRNTRGYVSWRCIPRLSDPMSRQSSAPLRALKSTHQLLAVTPDMVNRIQKNVQLNQLSVYENGHLVTSESWIVDSLGGEKVHHATTEAGRRRFQDALGIGGAGRLDDDHLRFVANALELRITVLLDDGDSEYLRAAPGVSVGGGARRLSQVSPTIPNPSALPKPRCGPGRRLGGIRTHLETVRILQDRAAQDRSRAGHRTEDGPGAQSFSELRRIFAISARAKRSNGNRRVSVDR